MNEIVWLAHYGVGSDDNPPGRGSGRYPKGSGKNPRNGHGGIFKFFQKKNEKTENKKNISLNRGPSEKIYDAIKNADPKKVNNIVRNLIKNEKMISEEQIKKLQSLDDEWDDLDTKYENLYNDLCIKYSKDVDAQMKKDGVDPEDKHRGYWEEDIINKDPEMVKIDNKVAEAYDRYKKEVENIASALTGEFGDKKNGDRSVNDIVINAIIDVSYEEDYLSHGGPGSGRYPKGFKLHKYLSRTEKVGKDKSPKSKAEILSKDINTTINEIVTGTNKVLSLKNKSKLNTKKLSDEQLSRAIRRIELERRYNSLTSEETNKGRNRVMNVLEILGSVTAVATSGVTVAAGIYNLKK